MTIQLKNQTILIKSIKKSYHFNQLACLEDLLVFLSHLISSTFAFVILATTRKQTKLNFPEMEFCWEL